MGTSKKVLILANNDSGLLSFRKEVISSLVENGFKVTVSVPNGKQIDKIRELGCNVIITDIDRRGTNILSDLRLLKHYINLLEKEKPDVVLTYTIKPNIYGGLACQIKKVPYIVNITGLGTAVENKGLLQRFTIALYKLALRKVNTVFFQNTYNRDFFYNHSIKIASAKLIPGSGVNLTHHVYQPYPFEGEKVRFIFISRIMRQKGVEDFFACAKEFHPQAEFHILGDCEEDYKDELSDLQEKGLVIYHGKQLDVRPFIKLSHCLIHPTFYPEGMSNVILESASAGRPVIATRRPGCLEAVDDGSTGFLFPERDRSKLFECVERFLNLSNEKRQEMGSKARAKMEREFDRKIVVDAYLEAINSIIK